MRGEFGGHERLAGVLGRGTGCGDASRKRGYAFFAAILLVLRIQGLIKGDFAAIWQTVGREVPAREVLVYLCAVVSLAGIGLVLRSVAATADM